MTSLEVRKGQKLMFIPMSTLRGFWTAVARHEERRRHHAAEAGQVGVVGQVVDADEQARLVALRPAPAAPTAAADRDVVGDPAVQVPHRRAAQRPDADAGRPIVQQAILVVVEAGQLAVDGLPSDALTGQGDRDSSAICVLVSATLTR